jgi:hypothetical protein
LNAKDQQVLTDKLTRLHDARIDTYRRANFELSSPTLSALLAALKIRK